MFNGFAIACILGYASPNLHFGLSPAPELLPEPLENMQICSHSLAAKDFSFEKDTAFKVPQYDGKESDFTLLGKRSFVIGKTKDANTVVSSQALHKERSNTQNPIKVVFELNSSGKIERCLPSPLTNEARQTECVAAAGTFEKNGDCLLPVVMLSDCKIMGGTMLNKDTCRVPKSGRVLVSNF